MFFPPYEKLLTTACKTNLLQLTAKGNFQVDFDKNPMFLRKNIKRAYADAKLAPLGQMSDEWHAMRVFGLYLNLELLLVLYWKSYVRCLYG